MKFTLDYINQLRSFVAQKQARADAIIRRANQIRNTCHTMSLEQLEGAKVELAEMRKDLAEHQKYIRDAKRVIAQFYRPATAA